MSYIVPTDEEEDEQQGQTPKLGGSSTFGGGSSGPSLGGGTEQQQQNTQNADNAQSKGTGFTNLQGWLDAGKGRDKGITNKGTELLGNESTAFEEAKAPVMNSTFTAAGNAADIFNSGSPDADTKAAAALNQNNDGPREVGYDANARKGIWDSRSLGNSQTASSVLARPAIEAGGYGAGKQRLDQVLFGSDAASRDAMTNQQKATGDFETKVGVDKTAAAAHVADLDKQAADASSRARGELEGEYKRRNMTLNTRVADRNAADALTRKQADEAGVVWDPTTGGWRKPGVDQKAGDWGGSGATRENVASNDERTGINRLNALLGQGTQQLDQSNTPYQAATRGQVVNPDYVAPVEKSPVSDDYANKIEAAITEAGSTRAMSYGGPYAGFTENIKKQMRDLTPEQREYIKQRYLSKLSENDRNDKRRVDMLNSIFS